MESCKTFFYGILCSEEFLDMIQLEEILQLSAHLRNCFQKKTELIHLGDTKEGRALKVTFNAISCVHSVDLLTLATWFLYFSLPPLRAPTYAGGDVEGIDNQANINSCRYGKRDC